MDNKRAWDVSLDDFDALKTTREQLAHIAGFGVLAPSSHNSQPWAFQIEDNAIVICPTSSRMLPASDPTLRQLFISLGCATENILVAFDYYGYNTTVVYEKNKEDQITVRIQCEKTASSRGSRAHLAHAIHKRRSHRGNYQNILPNEIFFSTVLGWQGYGIRVDLVSNKNIRSKMADISVHAGIKAMENEQFRKELSRYLVNNLTKKGTGIALYGVGIPTPLSFVVPLLARFVNLNKLNEKTDRALLTEHTPIIAVISTKSDTPESQIEAGKLYERIALFAVSQGLQTAVSAASVEVEAFYKEMQSLLQTTYRPQVFFRVGESVDKSPRPSPRIPIEYVIT